MPSHIQVFNQVSKMASPLFVLLLEMEKPSLAEESTHSLSEANRQKNLYTEDLPKSRSETSKAEKQSQSILEPNTPSKSLQPPSYLGDKTNFPKEKDTELPQVLEKTNWYGYQTLAVDGAALGAGLALGVGSNRFLTGFAVYNIGYALGAPIVHVAHHQWGRASISLGIRVLLPLQTSVLGFVFGGGATATAQSSAAQSLFLGYAIGASAAIIVDTVVLAKEKLEVSEKDRALQALTPTSKASKTSKLSIVHVFPNLSIHQDSNGKFSGASAGLVGTF